MSVRSIEAEVSIKSGVQAECSIGREVIVEVHEDVNLESLTATENGSYRPESGVDGWDRVTVAVPERVPVTESLSVTENGTYEPTGGVDGYDRVSVSVPERIPVTESLTATSNGVYEPDNGVDGYDHVTVNVPERQPDIESLTVTANGTYRSTKDGYNLVTVNVPERVPITESLSVTQNGTYTSPSGVDGYDRVVVDVPPTVPDIESLTVTENGEYTASGDGFNPVIVNVANVKKIKTGTYIPSETYASTGNREIVSLNDIGFTPTKFVLAASNIRDLNNTQYAMILTYYDAIPELNYVLRMSVTFSNTSGGTTSSASFSGWTSQAIGFFYLSNGVISYRTSSSNRLLKGVEYTWVAVE